MPGVFSSLLDQGKLIVCGFNSCVQNDCYRDIGVIRLNDLAECHLEMLRKAREPTLIIGVWHHDLGGPPLASDYIDPNVALPLIDKGFRLAIHGHRHRSNVQPHKLVVANEERMGVIGAGSLGAGPAQLPSGSNRQYNLILISDDYQSCTVHVREELSPGVFGEGRLISMGGSSSTEVNWTPTVLAQIPNSARSGGKSVVDADEIELMIRSDPPRALKIIESSDLPSEYKRRLSIEALEKGSDSQGLVDLIGISPQNEQELATVFAAGQQLHQIEFLRQLMENGLANMDTGLVDDLSKRLRAVSKFLGAG